MVHLDFGNLFCNFFSQFVNFIVFSCDHAFLIEEIDILKSLKEFSFDLFAEIVAESELQIQR